MTIFKVEVSNNKPGSFVISIFGSLDSEHYLELEEKVMAVIGPAAKIIMLDLAELFYISSMGISALLKIKKAVEQNQGKFMLVNPQPQVKKVFEIIKALPLETIFRSVEEADAYLSEMQQGEIDKGKSC
ncbi:MAG: STAS domain-containing protein [Candidatus Omnitrophica bacterium]|nr:STAS domain-containing protein [Candidatus Omnitrophota bacterium]